MATSKVLQILRWSQLKVVKSLNWESHVFAEHTELMGITEVSPLTGVSKLSGELGNQAQSVHTHNPEKRSNVGCLGAQILGLFFSYSLGYLHFFLWSPGDGLEWAHSLHWKSCVAKEEMQQTSENQCHVHAIWFQEVGLWKVMTKNMLHIITAAPLVRCRCHTKHIMPLHIKTFKIIDGIYALYV